ncbi:MAG TPA: hypothetical protein VFT42_02965 [Solirubrobacteraceae bacterium]|nr:hypothetical protein [Solirubrobacteraceae bacterium]
MPAAKRPSRDVMSGLPATRPQRRSARRDGARAARTTPADVVAAAAPAAPAKPAAKRPPARKATPRKAAPRKAGPRAARTRPPERDVPPAGYATPRPSEQDQQGADVLTSAVHAVGELAELGLGIGGRALRGALSRLPRL